MYFEFATAAKAAEVVRSQNYTLAPQASRQIQANIKVSSTNIGYIISRAIYETLGAMDPSEMILKDTV